MRPVPALRADTPIYAALSTMRDSRDHLAPVTATSADAELVGLVTLHDLLDQSCPWRTPPDRESAT